MSVSVAHKIEEKVRTDDIHISERIDFSGLLLSQPVLEGLTNSGFKRPSPIQLQAIPLGRCGLDLIVQAKSGTGKTCVFTVIALEGLNLQTDALQVLILAPTREIAIQIREVVASVGSCVPELKCHSFIGGTSVQQDKISLRHCHIATGTPGRIKQLIDLGALKTQSIRLFVLDEADKLLGGDLTESINWIYSSLPGNKQMLALSATYPETLAQHLTRYMRNPTFVRLNITDPALIGIKQYHVIVPDSPLPNKVFEAKTEAVFNILSSVSFEQCLIFSNLQTRAQSLQSELHSRNWPTQCIAGCLDQKDRSIAMEHLKTYKCRILISTDLTSRGIDADKVNMVINLDVPLDHETYLHRIGRAGRFGSHGAAISIVSKGKQEKELWAVERKCKTNIPKLPDPIPSDLATRLVALNLKLSDVITTEKIITQPDSPFKTYLLQDQLDLDDIGTRNTKRCDNSRIVTGTEIVGEGHSATVIDAKNERNGGGKEAEIASQKSSEIDLCNSSSMEFISAREERSLEEEFSGPRSISSGLDLCQEDESNQEHIFNRIEDEQETYFYNNNLDSNGKSANFETLAKSSVETEPKASLSHIPINLNASEEVLKNGGNADEFLFCTNAQKMSSTERTPVNFQIFQKDVTNKKLGNCSEKPCKEISAGGVEHGVNYHTSEIGVKTVDSENSVQKSQISHKSRKLKPPTSFAVSSFLKGLNETTIGQEYDEEDCSELTSSSVQFEKEADASEDPLIEKSEKENAMIEEGMAKGIKELNLHPTAVDGEHKIQCIDLVISNEVFNAKEQCSKMNLEKKVGQNNENQLHKYQVGEMAMRETRVTLEGSLATCNPTESHNHNKSGRDNGHGHLFTFNEMRDVPKSFLGLKKDFENFCLNPHKMKLASVFDSLICQLSSINLKPNIKQFEDGTMTRGFSKVMETKLGMKSMVERVRSERIGNPGIVKDFLKTSCLSKSREKDNDPSSVRPSSKNKGSKRNKENGRWNDTQNWRDRGSNDQDWRSKKIEDKRKMESFSSRHSKSFDDLLHEQLLLKKENKERPDILDHSCDSASDGRTECLGSFNEVKCVKMDRKQAGIEARTEMSRNDLNKRYDNSQGARPKLSAQTHRKIEYSTSDSTMINPEKECQMLDQMHLEMLRKRKKRKEKITKLQQQKADNEIETGNVENCGVSTKNLKIAHPITEENVNTSQDKNEMITVTEVEKVSYLNIPQSDKKNQSAVYKHENLVNDVIPADQELVCNHVVVNNQMALSALATTDDLPRNGLNFTETESTKLDEVDVDSCETKGSHLRVIKFLLKGLDLSSDSHSDPDELELDLRSTSEDVPLHQKSKRIPSGKVLTSGDGIRTPLIKTSDNDKTFCQAPLLSKKHHPPQVDQVTTDKKGTVSFVVKRIISHKPQTQREDHSPKTHNTEDVKVKKKGKISEPVKNKAYHMRTLSQKSNVKKNRTLNFSNNRSRSDEKFPLHDVHHQSTTLLSPLHPMHKYEHAKKSNDKKDEAKRRERVSRNHLHNGCPSFEEINMSDAEKFNGTFDFRSLCNWWSYWMSLYHNYINNSQCTSSYTPLNHYYNYPHFNYHPQEQLPVGPLPPTFYHHHYAIHHPSHYYYYHNHSIPDCGNYHQHSGFYSQIVASYQQKYTRRMARVMKEMTRKFVDKKRETSESEC